jgi:hypothetical protein
LGALVELPKSDEMLGIVTLPTRLPTVLQLIVPIANAQNNSALKTSFFFIKHSLHIFLPDILVFFRFY